MKRPKIKSAPQMAPYWTRACRSSPGDSTLAPSADMPPTPSAAATRMTIGRDQRSPSHAAGNAASRFATPWAPTASPTLTLLPVRSRM